MKSGDEDSYGIPEEAQFVRRTERVERQPDPEPEIEPEPEAEPVSVAEPEVAPPRPAPAPKKKRRPAAKKQKSVRAAKGSRWRAVFAWLGLFLVAGCGVLFLLDFKLEGLRFSLPDWHLRGLKPGELVVLLDPGHGGHDSGARGAGLVEKDLNLDLAKRVGGLLRQKGIRCALTREKDVFIPLYERTRQANELDRCVFVSIHFNHSKSRDANGIETYYAKEKAQEDARDWLRVAFGFLQRKPEAVDDSEDLAGAIQSRLVRDTSAVDRGIKKDKPLYVVRRTRHPAVLVEGGFVSNGEEAKKLGDSKYRQKLAEAIAEGILEYLGRSGHEPRGATAMAANDSASSL